MLKAVFFDFDETLGWRRKYAYRTYMQFITSLTPGLDPLQREVIVQDCMIWDMRGQYSKRFILENIQKKYGLNVPDKDEFYVWWNDNCAKNMVLYDGAEEIVKELQGKYKLAVVTNGSARGQYGKVRASGLWDCFDYCICSNDAGSRKPDKGIYLDACSHLGVEPEEVLFIGDTFTSDILGALSLGMKTVWFNPTGHPCDYDVAQIRDLRELRNYLD